MNTRVHLDGVHRCSWVTDDQIYIDYHDKEWGKPKRGQRELFEAMCLEGFQAGLSWLTILKRRDGIRSALQGFELEKVSKISSTEIDHLMQDPRMIRNRAKIQSVISNANLILSNALDLTELIWKYEATRDPTPDAIFEWNSTSKESEALSKELKKLGFSFVGATTMHALMESTGVIKDHAPNCFRSA